MQWYGSVEAYLFVSFVSGVCVMLRDDLFGPARCQRLTLVRQPLVHIHTRTVYTLRAQTQSLECDIVFVLVVGIGRVAHQESHRFGIASGCHN